MTDVIDDTLSWEQRRELRRKKRQELLAEADRLVQNTDKSASSRISNDRSGDDDSFEQERQRRRREREEKRKKEREELEKQLKEEEEARAERERRREERRRHRDDDDGVVAKQTEAKDSYSYSSTTVTTTRKTHHDSDEDVIEETVTQVTEVIRNGDEDYPTENGDEEEEDGVQNGHGGDEEEEQQEYEEEKQYVEVDEDDDGSKTYKSYTSVTTYSTTIKKKESDESASASSSDAEEEKVEETQEKSYQTSIVKEAEPEKKDTGLSSREERRRQREKERLEEERKAKEEEEKRKADHEARLKTEKEERERRMAEGEAKRKELSKQLSQEHQPLSPKGNASSPLIMKSDDCLSTAGKKLSSKKKEQEESGYKVKTVTNRTMETVKKTNFPTRSQSQHVRSKTCSPGTPTRPLSRKNQTRRSLNALEKQADDLYSFLSELEDHKSAGPEKLKEFLEKTERDEKSGQVSASTVTNLQHRTSIKDRMKQFSSIGEENKSPRRPQKGDQPSKPGGAPAKTPQPPKRSDSMKRLELARAKHLASPYKPLSPGSRSPNHLPPQSEIAEFDLGSNKNVETSSNSSRSDRLGNRSRDSLSSTSSHNEEHMHLSSNSDNEGLSMKFTQPESEIVNIERLKPSTTVEPQEKFESPVPKQEVRPIIKNQEAKKNDDGVSQSKSDASLPKEQNKHFEKESTEAVIKKEEEYVAEPSKTESGRVRTRRVRNRKPDLPPKPVGLSPSCSPHRSPARRVRGDPKPEKSLTGKPVEESKGNQSKSVDHARAQKEEEQKIREEDREARREARRARRHDGGFKAEKKETTLPDDDSHTSSMKDLNEKMADSPKTSKQTDTSIARISSLDDRLKSYTSRAQKQDSVRRGVATPKSGGRDVANRLNMWESGKVTGAEKTPKKALDTAVVKQGAGVSSRKNMWESGKVLSSTEKKAGAKAEVHGAGFSSRKDAWLKVSQGSTKSAPKSDSNVTIATGVMSRLNKWEKGEVNRTTPKEKAKASDLPVSDVVNRRSRWEAKAKDSPSQASKAAVSRTVITTDLSTRKNAYESKTQDTPKQVERKPISTGRSIKKEEIRRYEEDSEEEEKPQPAPKRRESLSSRSDSDDAQELSSESEDDRRYGRAASSDDSDRN